jgi:uncharacterized protein (TIGR02391 family)
MARRSQPPQPQPADLNPAQARSGIERLKRRISDLEGFDVSKVRERWSADVTALQTSIDETLSRVFGAHTTDYERYSSAANLDRGPIILGSGPDAPHEVQQYLNEGKQRALALLKQAVRGLEELVGDDQGGDNKILRAYQGLDLHSEIARAANDLYQNGHYANAIEDAVKALNDLVRLRSRTELDGTTLMENVFSPNKPILRFNELADQSDRDEQKGFMMMFSGAVAGLRNPRAHRLIKDDPERALEFIAYISLLAKLLDGAKKA